MWYEGLGDQGDAAALRQGEDPDEGVPADSDLGTIEEQTLDLPSGVADFDHGASDLVVDHQLSLDVAETVDAEPQGCFLAAYRTVTEGVLTEGLYVEGYVVRPTLPVPVLHAWVEWGEDRIVDPVYCSFSPDPQRRYFPGLRLTAEQILALDEAYPDTDLPYADFCYAQPALHAAVREAYYQASDDLYPGWGRQLRHLDVQAARHNQRVQDDERSKVNP